MPRFVILEHDHPDLHWDLMLESGAVLRTWRLAAPPTPNAAVRAEPSFDHRLLYLDYEGPVSGGRGVVTRWDWGEFEWRIEGERGVAVFVQGDRLRGLLRLECDEEGSWSVQLSEPEA
jgi:hypothetical protein